ncbi:ubiquitin carboxyl-terminal hydrolase 1 [Anaeramoeba ignava]|uniref:Ubiquitin carboxyl-terminal hydrolase 1 n=1 Tax=Anaeramoeba ignava TaxID=1746090 RepID=A0A9Q0LDW8_ANAIG|nr:ubiquitin carboxyl-terminal hydrolase 1 [Anaeramoeba ignava]
MNNLQIINSLFDLNQQQDAHELFHFLFNSFIRELEIINFQQEKINLKNLMNNFQIINSLFDLNQQQDAHELFHFLFSSFIRELKIVKLELHSRKPQELTYSEINKI